MASEAAFFPNALARASDFEGKSDSGEEHLSVAVGTADVPVFILNVDESDERLLEQIQTGDREALSLLFRRHGRTVYRVAQRILRDDAEAEDLLQEVFMFVCKNASAFDSNKSPALSWIVQMAYHRSIDRRRYLGSRRHYDAEVFVEERQGAASSQNPIDQMAAEQLLNRLSGELTPEQRQTLELHFFEGYTFHEIATMTGKTLGNVRNHYYRGIERLRSFVFPETTRQK